MCVCVVPETMSVCNNTRCFHAFKADTTVSRVCLMRIFFFKAQSCLFCFFFLIFSFAFQFFSKLSKRQRNDPFISLKRVIQTPANQIKWKNYSNRFPGRAKERKGSSIHTKGVGHSEAPSQRHAGLPPLCSVRLYGRS